MSIVMYGPCCNRGEIIAILYNNLAKGKSMREITPETAEELIHKKLGDVRDLGSTRPRQDGYIDEINGIPINVVLHKDSIDISGYPHEEGILLLNRFLYRRARAVAMLNVQSNKINVVKKLALLFFAAMAVNFSLSAATATVNGITWTYTVSNGQATLGGYSYPSSPAVPKTTFGNITIPSTLGGCPVTSIEYEAFADCSGLTGVTIPDSVTRIGWRAFYGCSGLTSVNIPGSVTSIGQDAFSGCSGLKDVTVSQYVLGQSIPSIFSSAYSSLTNVSCSSEITYIGRHAFYRCSGLTSVTIPDGVTSIGDEAFSACIGLTSVKIPPSVTYIGQDAFFECNNMKEVHISDLSAWCRIDFGHGRPYGANPLEYYTNGLYLNGEPLTGDVVLPEGLTHVPYCLLAGCSGITSVTIPDSVTSIGDYAFANCSRLAHITIPNGVSGYGSYVFWGCGMPMNVTMRYVNADIGFSSLWCTTHLLINFNVVFSDRVTSIGDYAFAGCNLTSITIPKNVTSIGNYAFAGCNLTSIMIPTNVTSIGNGVFSGCSQLTSIEVLDNNPCYKSKHGLLLSKDDKTLVAVSRGIEQQITIPDGVTNIADQAFCGCFRLTNVTIPKTVMHIGDGAFAGCARLTSIMVASDNSRYKSVCGMLLTKDGKTLVAVPNGLDCFSIPDSVVHIGDAAFSRCTCDGPIYSYSLGGPSHVKIPNIVTSIGRDAFAGCSELTRVIIPSSVASIGEGAFRYCSGLKAVSLLGDEPTCVSSIYNWSVTPTNYVTSAWTGPTDMWQDRVVRVVTDTMTTVDGNLIQISGAWLAQHPAIFEMANGGTADVAFGSTTANGRKVWECYALGLDPEDNSATNDFRIVSFPLKADGTPDIEHIVFDPPQARWNVSGARAVIRGAAALDAAVWPEVTEQNKASFRFFKVTVEMP